MSSRLQRARPQMIAPCTSRATALHALPIAARGGRKSGLDHIDAELGKRARHAQLLGLGHAAAGRLLAIAQRGVEDQYSVGIGSHGVISSRRGPVRSSRLLVQPGHAGAQLGADLLDLAVQVVLAAAAGSSCRRWRSPRSTACANLPVCTSFRILRISFLTRSFDDARAARQVAVLGGVADELVHLGEAALVQQVDDQLQLVQALVVGDLGLIAGLDQRLEALHHQLGRATAQHRLLAEQIRLGLLGKGRLEHAAARAADAVRVGERLGVRLAGGILRHGDQTRHAAALLVLAAHQAARALWARSAPRPDPCAA